MDCVSPTASMSSTCIAPRMARQTKHSSLTAPTGKGTPAESVAVVKPVSQQRYSLSAIVIPRLSISDDAEVADNLTG